jgi:hypothetical protein
VKLFRATVIFLIAITLMATMFYVYRPKEQAPVPGEKLIPAWLMISRFSITSHPETLIDVEQIDFERYPKLQEAFNVEEMSNAIGLVHPIEWVNCTHSEGVEIVELFGGKYDPQLKYYNFNIRYKNQNYSIYTPFSWKPPL